MLSINKVILIGNVVKDPEFRKTTDGRDVCNFLFATAECWKDKNTGEDKQKTEWHRITCFSVAVMDYIKQKEILSGALLWIEGTLQTRKWRDGDIDKASTEVVIHGYDGKLILLDSNRKVKSHSEIN